ncbi:MAG: GNAT family N-acetyltransferase [Clostridiales bacterium]|nr:GNAT family N-acetyltransferase [Clostridiales bacterium]
MEAFIDIVPVSAEELEALGALAEEIWIEHYTELLGAEQVAYMVERFQSPAAIAAQREEGYRYYFLRLRDSAHPDGVNGGYMGICPEEERLFLSKLYVHRNFRCRGLARAALVFLQEQCRREGYPCIRLTVNRRNSGSVAAYRKMGFVTVREQVADIGRGFVMDDYVMELAVPPVS